jgi:hypothetical protein
MSKPAQIKLQKEGQASPVYSLASVGLWKIKLSNGLKTQITTKFGE